MSKTEKKVELTLKQEAEGKMEMMVEQHNELTQAIQEQNNRLAELRNMIVEHQGYMKGLDACEESCEKDA